MLKNEIKEKNITIDNIKRTLRIDQKKLAILTKIDEKNEITLEDNKILIDKQEIAIDNLKERIIKKNYYIKKQRENLLKFSLHQIEISNKLAEILFFVRAVVHTIDPSVLIPVGVVLSPELKTKEIKEKFIVEKNKQFEIEGSEVEDKESNQICLIINENEIDEIITKEEIVIKKDFKINTIIENLSEIQSLKIRIHALQGLRKLIFFYRKFNKLFFIFLMYLLSLILFYSFYFIHFIHFIYFILSCFFLFYFILFCFISFHFILFYFILYILKNSFFYPNSNFNHIIIFVFNLNLNLSIISFCSYYFLY